MLPTCYQHAFKNKRNILWGKINNNEQHPKTPKIDNNNITLWNLKILYLFPQIEKIIAKLNYVIRTNFTDIRINIMYISKKNPSSQTSIKTIC